MKSLVIFFAVAILLILPIIISVEKQARRFRREIKAALEMQFNGMPDYELSASYERLKRNAKDSYGYKIVRQLMKKRHMYC